MIHISAKHKMIGVPQISALHNLFPYGILRRDMLILKHNLQETLACRQHGLNVPAPILSQYDWCGGTPFDVQRKTCAMLTTSPRAYCLNGMGTGKTKAALWAWDFLNKQKLAKKLLVVAPLSTLNFVWGREIMATLPGRRWITLHGSKDKRTKLLDAAADIYLINHDGLQVVYNQLKDMDIDTVVIDELAAFRNKTRRTKLMAEFVKPMNWVWGMTGSPTPRAPTDAFWQAHVVTPHNAPSSFNRFREATMLRVTQFKWTPKKDATETVHKLLQPAVRFELEDVVELPECIERTMDIDMSPKQKNVYDQMLKKAFAMIDEKIITAANAGAVMMKLLQISTGWVYNREGKALSVGAEHRIQALVDALEAGDRKTIVFTPFLHTMHGIVEELKGQGMDPLVVHGGVANNKRTEIFNEFQHGFERRPLVAHPKCCHHGLTLTAADTIIWFNPTNDFEMFEQANARIRRIGQKHKQLILMFQSTPLEKKVYTNLRTKQKVQNALLDMFAEQSA